MKELQKHQDHTTIEDSKLSDIYPFLTDPQRVYLNELEVRSMDLTVLEDIVMQNNHTIENLVVQIQQLRNLIIGIEHLISMKTNVSIAIQLFQEAMFEEIKNI